MGTLLNRRRYMGEKALPYDAEIEYLENPIGGNGGYINTGIIPTNATSSEIDFEVLQNDTNIPVCGVMASTTKRFILDTKVNNAIRFYWGSGSYEPRPYAYVNEHIKLVQESNNISITSNRRDVSGSSRGNWGTIGYPICLFIYFIGEPTQEGNAGVGLRIYYYKIYDNNTLVRDLVPVRVGTTGYMYDKVSDTLFGNAGTGDFTLGPDKIGGG